jgi:predicted RNA binding protein YcfA (HicA-like mRNA interferase family)
MTKRALPGQLPSKVIIAFLQDHGWIHVSTEGSHRQYTKPGHDKVTVPHPRDIETRKRSELFKSILRQAGVTRKEFADWYYSGRKSST